jgi:IS5 family transposase
MFLHIYLLIKICKKVCIRNKNLANLGMQSKPQNSNQLGFYSTYEEQLNHQHPLFRLSQEINWHILEQAFSGLYSDNMGRPAKPIRRLVSLLVLKHLRNLSDESVVEQWSENAYYQYFSEETFFCSTQPCTFSELHHFRARIGEAGIELILKESIRVNGKDGESDNLSADTTVQEKNITYPTDDKLYKKIISKCLTIANKEGITPRQSYRRTLKKLSFSQRMRKNKKGGLIARKADRKVKTIAGRLVRELERKLSADALSRYATDLALFMRVLLQKRGDNHKIYSLHEPHTLCISKGKEHKKYEFGSKVSILLTQDTGVIVGALNHEENTHDSKTLPDVLSQYERLTARIATDVYVDRGYRGLSTVNETIIHVPKPQKNITLTKRKRHKRRAAIEPVIGHLKSDYRLRRNFYKGITGDAINVMLAAAAMNFKRMMNKWKLQLKFIFAFFENLIFDNLKSKNYY